MNRRCVSMIALCLAACASQAQPQQEPGALQQEVRQLRDAMAANQQKLHGYQWIETVTLAIDGTSRTPRRYLCSYGPDGKLQRTSLDQQSGQSEGRGGAMPLRGGGLIRMAMAKKKKEKYQKETEQIRALVHLYMPFNTAKLRAAAEAGDVALNHNGTSEDALVIDNYAKQGDHFGITITHATMQIEVVSIKSWLDKPKDSVTGQLQFDKLPDGTVYPALTTVNAPAEKLSIMTANSDFSKPVD